jgi:hypothetical protein
VRRLLTAGFTLTELLGSLVDACEQAEAFDGESTAEVVVEMAAGSVGVRLHDVPAAEFERAAELIWRAVDAVVADVRLAADIAERRER